MEKEMIKYEIHITNLLKSEDVCKFIMNKWMYYKVVDGVGHYREYTVGQELSDEEVINTILSCLEDREYEPNRWFPKGCIIQKELGAIKIWEEFKSYAPEIREELIYGYILAFCEIVVSNDGRIIKKPKEQKVENSTLEEKIEQSVGNSVLSHLLGIPGIGLLAKFEDWEEKRRQEKIYYEIKNDIWENPLEEIMKLEKYQHLKKEMMKRVHESFSTEKKLDINEKLNC